VVTNLTPVHEAEFLGFSDGFRPGRSQHDALTYGVKGRNVRWILDANIRSFFDKINREWPIRLLQHWSRHRRIIPLVQNGWRQMARGKCVGQRALRKALNRVR
jgi:RNA-directed DNA polymerase